MAKTKKAFDYAGWEKKEKVKVDDKVFTSAEVNGMSKGTKLKVKKIQGLGAVFYCEVLTGPKHGKFLSIRATDIQ